MEFLAIMAVGTLIAIWAVRGSRPTHRVIASLPPVIPPGMNPRKSPEVWQYDPRDEFEYRAALDRHYADPARHPLPSEPDTKHFV